MSKAQADLETARRELAVAERPNLDAVAFHSQQCVEKLLKALLQERGIPFAKTHDLSDLVGALSPPEACLVEMLPALDELTAAAVEFRYPGA